MFALTWVPKHSRQLSRLCLCWLVGLFYRTGPLSCAQPCPRHGDTGPAGGALGTYANSGDSDARRKLGCRGYWGAGGDWVW